MPWSIYIIRYSGSFIYSLQCLFTFDEIELYCAYNLFFILESGYYRITFGYHYWEVLEKLLFIFDLILLLQI